MARLTQTKTVHILCLCTLVTLATSKRFVQRRTQYGLVRGVVQHVHGGGRVERFLGIPYAKPPTGKLRFEAPEPASPWRGVKDALELSPACPQPIDGVTYIQGHVPDFNKTSEDCLYLNVYAPRTSQQKRRARGDYQRKRKAVLVFVHGGSYLHGMGAMLEGNHLASRDIIVVTFNYRLGALGFLEADDEVFPGNYGLRDQILALRWIQDNIHHFGGDPTRVTLDGHSAGGCTVGLLALLPSAQGLFRRVIQQSGSPFAHWALTRRPSSPNLIFKLFTASLGCYGNGTAEVKACLQNVSAERMEEVIFRSPSASVLQNTIFSSLVPSFRPVVDRDVIPDTPEKLALTGRSSVTEFLAGTTTDEGLGAASTILERYYNKVDNFYSQDRPDPLLLVDLLGGSRAHLPNINSLLERLLDQYYVWPYDVDENQSKDGLVEIVGDFFISAPTHKSAEVMQERNATVYFYNYDYISQFDGWAGVIHGSELFYLSGYPFSRMRRHDKAGRTMASHLLHLWSSFAKNGIPSLAPNEDFQMPAFTKENPRYTQMTSIHGRSVLKVGQAFKADKMEFWNYKVPQLYLDQLRQEIHMLDLQPLHPALSHRGDHSNVVLRSSPADDHIARGVPPGCGKSQLSQPYISGHWVLITACIGLSGLVLLLSICYCQVRRQVNRLMRQSSLSSGQPIL